MIPEACTGEKVRSVRGVGVDGASRCAHYATERDIVAIRFACCGHYYACRLCHDETADHPAQTWPKTRFSEPAVLCGACGTELSVWQYLDCHAACPACATAFNPGCERHRHLYFETDARLAPTGGRRSSSVRRRLRTRRRDAMGR